jgi:hypothetical protein
MTESELVFADTREIGWPMAASVALRNYMEGVDCIEEEDGEMVPGSFFYCYSSILEAACDYGYGGDESHAVGWLEDRGAVVIDFGGGVVVGGMGDDD